MHQHSFSNFNYSLSDSPVSSTYAVEAEDWNLSEQCSSKSSLFSVYQLAFTSQGYNGENRNNLQLPIKISLFSLPKIKAPGISSCQCRFLLLAFFLLLKENSWVRDLLFVRIEIMQQIRQVVKLQTLHQKANMYFTPKYKVTQNSIVISKESKENSTHTATGGIKSIQKS